MKNKKNKWRHILLRGSALMAAVLMCFAGSFPVFAAEDPAEPGGSVTLIKAGTYRFNDVLTIPFDPVSDEIIFTSNIGEDDSILAECVGIGMGLSDGDSTGKYMGISLYYYVNSLEPNPGFEVPDVYTVYFADSTRNKRWYTDSYGEGIQTITIPNDTDVSVEFAEWFRNNTVPVSPSSKVLEGEWTFKQHLSVIRDVASTYILDVPFSVSGVLTSSDVEAIVQAMADNGFEFTPVLQDYVVTSSYSGLQLSTTSVDSSFLIVDYLGSVVSCSPYDSQLIELLTFSNVFNSIDDYNSYEGWKDDFLRTVDFGAGAAIESPEFYAWFTSNAIPHRDMWSLTERLQAVAASIWSVIVTIASTIVSNPLLLFTSGFLFLGGCIALFSRLLARR